jgi:uncharacterized protein VirK/YbjX
MSAADRRRALAGHYRRLEAIACASPGLDGWCDGMLLWEAPTEGEHSLGVFLEPAKFAPMEGELQLRFAWGRRNLFTLTFLFAPGDLFANPADTILFIGGVQGAVDCRVEMREAAKSNGEIAPAVMLLLTIRALAKILDIEQIVAAGEEEQISKSYASDRMKLDYRKFWTEAGGLRRGSYYILPIENIEKPLHEIPISHRSRTRRKRERKRHISDAIETQLRLSVAPSNEKPKQVGPDVLTSAFIRDRKDDLDEYAEV